MDRKLTVQLNSTRKLPTQLVSAIFRENWYTGTSCSNRRMFGSSEDRIITRVAIFLVGLKFSNLGNYRLNAWTKSMNLGTSFVNISRDRKRERRKEPSNQCRSQLRTAGKGMETKHCASLGFKIQKWWLYLRHIRNLCMHATNQQVGSLIYCISLS